MSFIDWMQAIKGDVGQKPSGPPGVVGIVPDDWFADAVHMEGTALAIVANAAGFRSEIAIFNNARTLSLAYEIRRLFVTSGTAGAVIGLVAPSAGFSGFADVPIYASDLSAHAGVSELKKPSLKLGTKNSAAATAGTQFCGGAVVVVATASVWVEIPGRFILRASADGGGQMLLRPDADNVGMRAMFQWRQLERRKL